MRHKHSVGDRFILRKSPVADNHGIPDYDFGKELTIVVLCDSTRHVPEYITKGGTLGWYVLEDMMEPVGGPW